MVDMRLCRITLRCVWLTGVAVALGACSTGQPTDPIDEPSTATVLSVGVYGLHELSGFPLPVEVPGNTGTTPVFPRLLLVADTLNILEGRRFRWRTTLRDIDSVTTFDRTVAGYLSPGRDLVVAYALSGWIYDTSPNFPVAEIRTASPDAVSWEGFGPWLGVERNVFDFRRVP